MCKLERDIALGYARGTAGGLLVGLPLLMTMEMWWAGFYMPPAKMLLFLVINFGILLILEHYSGFRRDVNFLEELQDAIVAVGLGLLISFVVLLVLNRLRLGMPLNEWVGKTVMQSIPVSIGASVSMSQLGVNDDQAQTEKQTAGFWGTKGIALAGAVFFGFNIAPTEEPMQVGLELEWWHGMLLMLVSLVQVHAIVYAVEFKGGKQIASHSSPMKTLFGDSLSSYVIALLSAALLLWIFGRIDSDTGFTSAVYMTLVLGYVNSIGAAAARLLL